MMPTVCVTSRSKKFSGMSSHLHKLAIAGWQRQSCWRVPLSSRGWNGRCRASGSPIAYLPPACTSRSWGADEISAFIRHQLRSDAGVLTDEAVTAIASISGGDPVLANRFSRRLLDFAAASPGDRPEGTTARAVAQVPVRFPALARNLMRFDEPPLPSPVTREPGIPPSARTWPGSGTTGRASVAAGFCLSLIAMLAAVWLMHPADEYITASATPNKEASAAGLNGRSPLSDPALPGARRRLPGRRRPEGSPK
jgi:hypothetical protein